MPRTFVIGDIHGAHKALVQCLERSSFDYEADLLICLGDVCDGWPETSQCFDELLKIKHLIYVLGNHDYWALYWAEQGIKSDQWLLQGGQATVDSYPGNMFTSHVELLKSAHHYYLLEDKLFVHAGILPDQPISDQDDDIFLWDRTLVKLAIDNKISGVNHSLTQYKEVYVGHTPIHRFGFLEPTESSGVWMMDTGAGWEGALSIMDIETKVFYQSDAVINMYPKGTGRPGQA
ncbi:MAG: metallophosphoesterase [Bacteroidota bacterium]